MPVAEPVPIEIVYEDADVLALNKPAGLVIHPTYKNASGTLLNGILWHLRDRPDVRPGLVSRLDKNTSGIVLVALSTGAHARIQRDAHAGRVTKQYIAIVRGTPQPVSGTITLPLRRDPVDRRRVITDETGQRCETRYEVVSSSGARSVVQCEPVTGRTHQIRVHLASSGWPIVGDDVYGSADERIARQALHAWKILLSHPVTNQPLTLEAPIPEDMRTLMTET